MAKIAEERKMNNLNEFQTFDLKNFLSNKELEIVTVNKVAGDLNLLVEIIEDSAGFNKNKVITVKVPFSETEDSLPLELFKGGQPLSFDSLGEILKVSYSGARIIITTKGIMIQTTKGIFKLGEISDTKELQNRQQISSSSVETNNEKGLAVKKDLEVKEESIAEETYESGILKNIQPPSITREVIEKQIDKRNKNNSLNKRKRKSRFHN